MTRPMTRAAKTTSTATRTLCLAALSMVALSGAASSAKADLDLSISLNFGWCDPDPCESPVITYDAYDVDYVPVVTTHAWRDPFFYRPLRWHDRCNSSYYRYESYSSWDGGYRYESYRVPRPYVRFRGWDDDCYRPYGGYGWGGSGLSIGYTSSFYGGGVSFSYSSGPLIYFSANHSNYFGGYRGHGYRHPYYRPVVVQPVIVQPVIVQPVVVQPVIVQQPIINTRRPVINTNPPVITGSGQFVGPVAQPVIQPSTLGTEGIAVDGSLPERNRSKPSRVASPSNGQIGQSTVLPQTGFSGKPVVTNDKPASFDKPVAVKPIESMGRDRVNQRPSSGKPAQRDPMGPIGKPQFVESKPVDIAEPAKPAQPIQTGKPGTLRSPSRGNDFNVINQPAASQPSKPSQPIETPALPSGVREIKPQSSAPSLKPAAQPAFQQPVLQQPAQVRPVEAGKPSRQNEGRKPVATQRDSGQREFGRGGMIGEPSKPVLGQPAQNPVQKPVQRIETPSRMQRDRAQPMPQAKPQVAPQAAPQAKPQDAMQRGGQPSRFAAPAPQVRQPKPAMGPVVQPSKAPQPQPNPQPDNKRGNGK